MPVGVAAGHDLGVVDLHLRLRIARQRGVQRVEQQIAVEAVTRRHDAVELELQLLVVLELGLHARLRLLAGMLDQGRASREARRTRKTRRKRRVSQFRRLDPLSRQSSRASLTASFMPPTAFCTLPAVFCALPSPSSLASPVALPATSLILPLPCSSEPSMRSLFMSVPLGVLDLTESMIGRRERSRARCLPRPRAGGGFQRQGRLAKSFMPAQTKAAGKVPGRPQT